MIKNPSSADIFCKDFAIEIEKKHKNRKLFILMGYESSLLFIDTKVLSPAMQLCMICDGEPLISHKVGSKGQFDRSFIDIDWVINEWGGDEKVIGQFKLLKEKYLKEGLPKAREDLKEG